MNTAVNLWKKFVSLINRTENTQLGFVSIFLFMLSDTWVLSSMLASMNVNMNTWASVTTVSCNCSADGDNPKVTMTRRDRKSMTSRLGILTYHNLNIEARVKFLCLVFIINSSTCFGHTTVRQTRFCARCQLLKVFRRTGSSLTKLTLQKLR